MRLSNGLAARILAIVLLTQAAAYYAVASRSEILPSMKPLSEFPGRVGDWTVEREFPIEKEVQDVLKADDTLSRLYISGDRRDGAALFVAFFQTQRFGQAPHSPKNCLPGSGWQPTQDRKLPIAIPGRQESIVVNEYVVERGDQKSVVLYWYQSHNRAIASEFAAKFWLVSDAIRYHRSDTALVRIIVPVHNDLDRAEETAIRFVQTVYPDVTRHLPN
jgi:EpsI family protein